MWKQTKVISQFVYKKLIHLACSDCLHGEAKICLLISEGPRYGRKQMLKGAGYLCSSLCAL